MLVAIAMFAQDAGSAKMINCSCTNAKLNADLLCREHASLPQTSKTALQIVRVPDDGDLLNRKGFAFPVPEAKVVKSFCNLLIRTSFEQFVDLCDHLRESLAD